MSRLIIDGNAVYEIDEECMRRKRKQVKEKQAQEPQAHRSARTDRGNAKPSAEGRPPRR